MCQYRETCKNCTTLSKLAAKNGYRLKPTLILSSYTKRYKVKLEKITEKVPIDRIRDHPITGSHITITTASAAKMTTTGKKTIGRPQTQSERSKARKMKRREQQRAEIAAKQTAIATNQPANQQGSLPTNIMPANDSNSVATFAVAEAVAGIKMIMPPTKRPRTHFRKTKKPARV